MSACGGNILSNANAIDLEKELSDSNKRVMAIQSNVLDQIGAKIEVGKRTDLFWLVISVLVAGVLIAVSIFGKKKKR